MPIPKPRPDEARADFMKRCMGDSVMNSEYPDNSQRAAICNSQWERRGGRSMAHVRVKSIEGLWEEKDIEENDLLDWFADHTKDGVVCDDIVLFTDAVFKAEGDGVSWVMSDMSLDRDSERVDPNGADMKNFKRNPVVLWAHDTRTPAIGKVVNTRVKENQVQGKIIFDSKENDPFAGMIAGKVKAGIIQAGSIGFKPNSVEFIEESKDPTRLIHRKWELLEFSICNVPANANAMVQSAAVPEEGKGDSKPEEPNPLQERIDALEKELKEMHNVILERRKTYVDTLFTDNTSKSIEVLWAQGKTSPVSETSSDATNGTLDGLIGEQSHGS